MKNNYKILAYLSMRGLFLGVGLSNILALSKEKTLPALLLGMFLGLIIINVLNKKTDYKIFNIIQNTFLFIASFLLLINMISTMYLTKMPRIIIGIPIIVTILYLMKKKEIVIFRISNILFIINIALYLFASISLIKYVDIRNLYYTNVSALNFLSASLKYALYSSFPFMMFKNMINENINLNKTYIISSLTMSIIILTTYLILGPSLSQIFKYPEYIILKKVSIGSFVNNIENIISFMWIIDEAILLFIASNNIKKEISKSFFLPFLIFLFLASSILSNNYLILLFLYKNLHFIILFLILIHLILLKLPKKFQP